MSYNGVDLRNTPAITNVLKTLSTPTLSPAFPHLFLGLYSSRGWSRLASAFWSGCFHIRSGPFPRLPFQTDSGTDQRTVPQHRTQCSHLWNGLDFGVKHARISAQVPGLSSHSGVGIKCLPCDCFILVLYWFSQVLFKCKSTFPQMTHFITWNCVRSLQKGEITHF